MSLFTPLNELQTENEVIITYLYTKTYTLTSYRNRKHFNTGLSPACNTELFTKWTAGDNLAYSTTLDVLGGETFVANPKVICINIFIVKLPNISII
ncbi:MAG: hypothetical protein KBE41_02920 [Lutibacter sp.]|nr:hypothetical protein [Lutibacter sp.]MBP9600431.1 hypothetical protein [Lutibacter sp.]